MNEMILLYNYCSEMAEHYYNTFVDADDEDYNLMHMYASLAKTIAKLIKEYYC